MRKISSALLLWSWSVLCFGQEKTSAVDWIKEAHNTFDIFYTKQDSVLAYSTVNMINKGEKTVTNYFDHPLKHKFSVYIFPSRHDLDLQWQHDYGDTSIRSECWMVASGVGDVLQILSPRTWKTEACEHDPADSAFMQKLIAHELVHVFHGQYNPVHDFTGLDSLAWLIEGVATFVSGQLDESKMQQVKQLFAARKEPTHLKFFWTGNARYALAGSIMKFIADRYGKEKLFELLSQTDQRVILQMLNTTEEEFVTQWKQSLQ